MDQWNSFWTSNIQHYKANLSCSKPLHYRQFAIATIGKQSTAVFWACIIVSGSNQPMNKYLLFLNKWMGTENIKPGDTQTFIYSIYICIPHEMDHSYMDFWYWPLKFLFTKHFNYRKQCYVRQYLFWSCEFYPYTTQSRSCRIVQYNTQ